ncbi:unnamed protein product [Owenia fusiformis]|uniref:Methyltransferase domain-containing protein n=1 Tax=Owenia fusiformis TaxID=6347 RepID=A0A8S4PBE4_OWEFU|nr:unnamed protein product [Owenia fusiformis]
MQKMETEDKIYEDNAKNAFNKVSTFAEYDEVHNHYKNTAETYDKMTASLNYNGPKDLLKELFEVGMKCDWKILDVAAGTGILGRELQLNGCFNIDALDCCQQMLDKAKEKNIYRELICSKVGDGAVLPIGSNTYDAVVMSGAFFPEHLQTDSYLELTRIVKSGGLIGNIHRKSILKHPNYLGLSNFIKSYEEENIWRLIKEKVTKNYYNGVDGMLQVFKIL